MDYATELKLGHAKVGTINREADLHCLSWSLGW